MPNHLKDEVSPYLLQHADNPVDWYPWGEEALSRARSENKPIFLSIGYSACHWCHVMAHESFEDAGIAALLNEHFINIKVDREERPDLDNLYMNAVVAMTGQGGWPMSVFLTPEGKPFYGGTYFPPQRRHGLPAFTDVLEGIVHTWKEERGEIDRVSMRLSDHLVSTAAWSAEMTHPLSLQTLDDAVKTLRAAYDWQYGGWGKAPKFPQPMAIEFLLRQATRGDRSALMTAVHALDSMVRGGMMDVVGGGFHRYSTDSNWLVPHFEKMLYDNAQLAQVYLHAYRLTDDEEYKCACTETLDFIARELRDPRGGFFSSLDADVEGEEGTFYLWTPAEVQQVLTDENDLKLFTSVYPLNETGNFEGKTILSRIKRWTELSEEFNMPVESLRDRLLEIKVRLRQARDLRTRPATDDKVLVSWNALALTAFAEAARFLGRDDYLEIAQTNARFLLENLYQERLMRAWRKGQSRHPAFLEDYGGLIVALISLYQASFDVEWYQWAVRLGSEMMLKFSDPNGGFFDTVADADAVLLMRPKELQDNATPSGNALAAYALLLLGALDYNFKPEDHIGSLLSSLQGIAVRYPTSFSYWLQVIDFALGPLQQIALMVPEFSASVDPYLDLVRGEYRPRTILAGATYPPSDQAPPLLADRPLQDNRPTVYICEGFTCLRPINELENLQAELPLFYY